MGKTFAYRARDSKGQALKGSVVAENEAAVAAYIRELGCYVTKIEEKKDHALLVNIISGFQWVGTKDLAVFCRQMSVMIDAGLPLTSCLNILIEQTNNSRLRQAIRDIYRSVQAGDSLSKAMQAQGNVFPKIVINMTEAGETGGVLDDVMARLATHFEKENKLNERLKSAMVYPTVLMAMAMVSLLFMLTFVIPTFTILYKIVNVDLPLPTRFLLSASDIMLNYGMLILLVLLAVGTSIGLALKKERYRLVLDLVVFQIPVFGILWRKAAIARFSRTLSTLVRGGIPIVTALEVVMKTSGNLSIVQALTKVQKDLREGVGIASSLQKSSVFPPMVVQMVAVGEETGELDAMLEKLADFFESDVDDMVTRFSSLLEPVLIGTVGIVIGLIVVSVILPIFDVITNLNLHV
ncbi:MAG TPA: type II secretion system F family protein [Methylomusa anaerophila]|uniref:Type II secretion system protein F n=1 Tax=Methylomusa anaerophila TaxID=1930071 RepID=A0A348AQH5_9FIRM|nr:type II secretion system F family protein [Methylomusa anaerophila]BBB93323.1 type II secretion system protein F [Methylomusa anaerophila]HML86846.1 type II secretion system F family protein [Methylomusa anaerophila]